MARRITRKHTFLLSVVIHVVAITLVFGPPSCSGGHGKSSSTGIDLIESDKKSDEKATTKTVPSRNIKAENIFKPKTVDPQRIQGPGPGRTVKDTSCPGKSFVGIGVVYSRSGIVSEVPDGFPASRAGIAPGDVLLNVEVAFNKPVGTPVKLLVSRDGSTYEVNLVLEKICYTER